MSPSKRRKTRARAGMIAVIAALSLSVILAGAAVAVDGGLMVSERRQTQAASDAAALAASYVLYKNLGDQSTAVYDAARLAATTNAASNGFSAANGSVVVNIPPKSGPFANTAGYVEVIVTNSQSRHFSGIWAPDNLAVSARSVARGIMKPDTINLLLLNPTASSSYSGVGSSDVTVQTNGRVVVDSNSPDAVDTTGNATIVAGQIDITGNYISHAGLTGTIYTGVAPTPDPYISMTLPTKSGLTVQSSSHLSLSGGSYTLQPGIYTGGISATSGASITMQPGIYYIDGGGLSMAGIASLSGNGVVIYNVPQSSNDSINLTGNGAVTLNPPTSGPYVGMSLLQSRTGTAPVNLDGNGNLGLNGVVYAPKAVANLTGNGSTDNFGSQIIADTAVLGGNGIVTLGANGGPPPSRDTRLVE